MGIFSFFLPIGIFGIQPAIFRLQKHKFSIKSKILFGYSIFICTFAAQTTSLTINFQSDENKHLPRNHQRQGKQVGKIRIRQLRYLHSDKCLRARYVF